MSLVQDEKRPTRRGPCAVKVARTVPTGGMERRIEGYRALSLPTPRTRLTRVGIRIHDVHPLLWRRWQRRPLFALR